jgi:hypothetical protein
MAEVSQREWKIPGQRTKRLAWGYTVTVNVNGEPKRQKSYRAEWTKEQAQEALAKVLLQVELPKPAPELLGHASLTMTMRYAHLAPERLKHAVSRLDGLTSGVKPSPLRLVAGASSGA